MAAFGSRPSCQRACADGDSGKRLWRIRVFGRAARPSDALPARPAYTAGSGAIAAGGIIRRIGPAGGAVTEWGSAKGDELCITVGASAGVASGGPAACNQLAILSQPKELLVMAAGSGGGASKSGDPPPPSQVVAGLAPNGVSSVTINFTNGTSAVVPVANNGFVLNTDGRTPGTYKWVADGSQNTE
jgi:hypothetical protein